MKTTGLNISDINSTYIDMYVIPADDRNQDEDFQWSSVNFTWETVEFKGNTLSFKLKFSQPL
jgi:hypothetical protein